jgi:cytochrome c2
MLGIRRQSETMSFTGIKQEDRIKKLDEILEEVAKEEESCKRCQESESSLGTKLNPQVWNAKVSRHNAEVSGLEFQRSIPMLSNAELCRIFDFGSLSDVS